MLNTLSIWLWYINSSSSFSLISSQILHRLSLVLSLSLTLSLPLAASRLSTMSNTSKLWEKCSNFVWCTVLVRSYDSVGLVSKLWKSIFHVHAGSGKVGVRVTELMSRTLVFQQKATLVFITPTRMSNFRLYGILIKWQWIYLHWWSQCIFNDFLENYEHINDDIFVLPINLKFSCFLTGFDSMKTLSIHIWVQSLLITWH